MKNRALAIVDKFLFKRSEPRYLSYSAKACFVQPEGIDDFIPHLPLRRRSSSIIPVQRRSDEAPIQNKELFVLKFNNQALGVCFHFSIERSSAFASLMHNTKKLASAIYALVLRFLEISPGAERQEKRR